MPIYGYICRECGHRSDSTSRSPSRCACGETLRRDYSTVQLRPTTAFQPHFNHSVGQHVSTQHDFTEALKRTAENNTAYTGTEHSYEMRDPAELSRATPPGDTNLIDRRPANEEKWLRGLQL